MACWRNNKKTREARMRGRAGSRKLGRKKPREDFVDHRFYSKRDERHWRLLIRFTL